MNKKIIAVFGGSFNPPAVSHINLAKQILTNIDNVEKVMFVPVSTKYNKSGLASDEDRFWMLQKVCENEKRLEVSSIELDSSRQLYTIETLEKLKKQNPDYEIYFVLGTDNLKELETWHKADELVENFHILVLERDEDIMEEVIGNSDFLKRHKDSFIKLENIKKIDLSSSFIRERIKSGKLISRMVPETIENKVLEIYQ